MIISFRSIQKWMRVRKVRRELKNDQALRERCIGYVTKVSGTSSFMWLIIHINISKKENCLNNFKLPCLVKAWVRRTLFCLQTHFVYFH